MKMTHISLTTGSKWRLVADNGDRASLVDERGCGYSLPSARLSKYFTPLEESEDEPVVTPQPRDAFDAFIATEGWEWVTPDQAGVLREVWDAALLSVQRFDVGLDTTIHHIDALLSQRDDIEIHCNTANLYRS